MVRFSFTVEDGRSEMMSCTPNTLGKWEIQNLSEGSRISRIQAYQPKVGEVSSAVHIDNNHVFFQVQFEESGKHGQFYCWSISALPLCSSFCNVLC